MSPKQPLTRRTVLKTTGGSLFAIGSGGLAAADPGDGVRVNVGFESESGRRAAREAADEVVRDYAFDAATLRLPKRTATALSQRSDVRYVERDGTAHALSASWGHDRIDADVANANGFTGDGADVAIVDTGLPCDHPCLPNVGTGKAFTDCASNCCAPWADDNGHGMNVAGIIGASQSCDCTTGVAPDATLHGVKVLNDRGSGSYSDIAAGIEYVADRGWDVANISLGGSSGSSVLKDACEYAQSHGVLLVGAAGGSGPCDDCVGYPAAYSEVVAVGATDRNDALASFSSRGPEIEVVAPGTDLRTLGSDGSCPIFSGTSFATAHVSGVAALLTAEGRSNTDARTRLRDTAEDLGLSSDEQGYGLVDAAAAVGLDSSDD
ncbi:S8 family serine peptidase [Halorussus sp. MSC15.2]|uniref:S8 family peptidase n=1 Tax=Halorussus sp. MSC15.2 TaxID=2283638 RepID=UPI0013D6151D|nr:S8 family serine peptidase [Halorussus sp. MSC15.2]NEU57280.1 S8 family serine peptidase [Halorussus sp. MSC15.2]